MKINPGRMFASLSTHSGIAAPFLLVCAIASSVFTANEVMDMTRTISRAEAIGQPLNLKLSKSPITAGQAKALAERVATLNPATKISVSGSTLVVSIQDPSLFPEFISALSSVQAANSEIMWETRYMCLNACQSGTTARIEVTGFTQLVQTSI